MSADSYAHRYQVFTPYGVDLVVSETMHHELGAVVFKQGSETVAAYAPGHWLNAREEDVTRAPGLWESVRRSVARRVAFDATDPDRPDYGA